MADKLEYHNELMGDTETKSVCIFTKKKQIYRFQFAIIVLIWIGTKSKRHFMAISNRIHIQYRDLMMCVVRGQTEFIVMLWTMIVISR